MNQEPDEPNPFATPKAPPLRPGRSGPLELATLWQRLAGWLIDNLIMLAGVLLVVVSTGDFEHFLELLIPRASGAAGGAQDPLMNMSEAGLTGMTMVITFLGVIQLSLIFRRQQTIGKWSVGSRMQRTDGSPATGWRILLARTIAPNILYYIPVLGPPLAIFGHLMIFAPARRCLHDYIADTVVVQA